MSSPLFPCYHEPTLPPSIEIRLAQPGDIPALESVIRESVLHLQVEYTIEQRQTALGSVFGVDRQLISDATYYAAEADGAIVACGGWSRRKTLYGSDHAPARDDAWLDPRTDAARIRAFFVHPAWARRGIGSRILQTCESAAAAMGFKRLEMAATLSGVPLYRVHGYDPIEEFEVPLPNGAKLPVVRMIKLLS
jgi:GNAT superfamily N-acetyltransferase